MASWQSNTVPTDCYRGIYRAAHQGTDCTWDTRVTYMLNQPFPLGPGLPSPPGAMAQSLPDFFLNFCGGPFGNQQLVPVQ